jgi:hypothetical protein
VAGIAIREARVALGRVGPVGRGVSSGFYLSVLMHASLCGQAGGKGLTESICPTTNEPAECKEAVPDCVH